MAAEAPELVVAAREGHWDTVSLKVRKGQEDPNVPDSTGLTVLILAADRGRKEMVKTILDAHADPNHAAQSGVTALHVAAYKNDTHVATLLLERRADANQAVTKGVTPLFLACFKGNVAMSQLLCTKGMADLELGASSVGITPLFCAAEKGFREVVRVLIAERHKRQESQAGIEALPNQQDAAEQDAESPEQGRSLGPPSDSPSSGDGSPPAHPGEVTFGDI